jgi:hypothetical protein
MTFQRMVTASCDSGWASVNCQVTAEASGWTVEEAWGYAKEAGWHRNGNRTICPVCWDEGHR